MAWINEIIRELAQTVRECVRAGQWGAVCAGEVVRRAQESSADRLLALAVSSMQSTAPGSLGTQLEGQQAGQERKILYFAPFAWEGRPANEISTSSFIWTNLKKKEQKMAWIADTASHAGSSHLLRQGGSGGAQTSIWSSWLSSDPWI